MSPKEMSYQDRVRRLIKAGSGPEPAQSQARSELRFLVTVPGLFIGRTFRDADPALRWAMQCVYLQAADKYNAFLRQLLDGEDVQWEYGSTVLIHPFIPAQEQS